MSNPVDVKWFDSTMAGAPVMSGTAGALIGVLDGCLLSAGFGSVTLNSLVVASGVATATVNTGHGFFDHVVVLIGGSTPSGLNGDKRITKVSATVFTFDAAGIADGTATGTITAKMSPMGWTKAFSGTNKSAYARYSAQATAMLLRVDDSSAQYGLLNMYESMSAIDTGTGQAPASGNVYCGKSSASSSTARAWRLYIDDLMVYLFIDRAGDSSWTSGFCFGDIIPYRSGDAYHCILVGGQSDNQVNYLSDFGDQIANSWISRNWSQMGSPVASARYSHRKCQYAGQGTMEFPSWTCNSLHTWPIEVWETTARARGLLPGAHCPIHATDSIPEGLVVPSIPNLNGGSAKIQKVYTSRYMAINITGPWR